jgi:hypothetical protein
MAPSATSNINRELLVRPPAAVAAETAGFTQVLLSNATIAAGAEKRLWPGLDVSKWDRVHLTVGGNARAVDHLNVRVILSTPIPGTHCGGILTSSTIWYEGSAQTVDFEHETPPGYGQTGFTMSVPVVAPVLYDVILRNTGATELTAVYVTLFAQEI